MIFHKTNYATGFSYRNVSCAVKKDYVMGYSRLFSYSQIEPANLNAILGIEENRCKKTNKTSADRQEIDFSFISNATNSNRK